MGCRYACVCSGKCWNNCTSYEPESYCGEAEDIYDETHGRSKEREEYEAAMRAEYEKDMQEEYERAMMEQYDKEIDNGGKVIEYHI